MCMFFCATIFTFMHLRFKELPHLKNIYYVIVNFLMKKRPSDKKKNHIFL